MPKIKDLTNNQLGDYLDAYMSMLSTDPGNVEYKRKVKCIEIALHRRDLINYDLPGANEKTSLFKKIFSIFKKK